MAINRQKISQMTPKGADLDPTDLFEVSVDTGSGYETRSITGQEIIDGVGGGAGTVTSVDLTMPSAFTVSGNPITTAGTLAVTGAGLVSQYVRGDGSLANFPSSIGGGASTSYYLNGSVNQGTIGGVTYYEMNKTPILGTGTDFSRNTNGYIASFLTDANDPALLKIPGGNWNLELYFSASSGGGTPTFYVELFKYDGATFTLIASSSTNPDVITGGTSTEAYFTTLAVPETVLTATDRLALRIYVTPVGRTITLHTEDNNLCQIITTFTTGLTALNGLTDQVQNFTTGTSGTDFGISSTAGTHTFNLPTASATNTGKLSSTDWTNFNNKVSTGAITGSGLTLATNRLLGRTTAGSGAVEEISIGTGLTLSGGTLSSTGGGITVGTTAVTSGTDGRVFFQAGGVVQQDGALFWDNTNKMLGVGTATPSTRLDIQGTASTDSGQLGAELLSTTGWTTTGWTGDFTTGFTHTTGNTSVLSNTLAAVVNTYYQIAYTITGRTAGSVTIAFGGQSIAITATGTFGPRATTTGNLTITPTTDFDGTIIISIKVISTYNATVTFKSSDGTVVNEIRNHSINSNTFIGRTAGNRTTTGINNSFFGVSAGQNNTTGTGNSFFGSSAGANNTTGVANSFFGQNAGQLNTTGGGNTFIGVNAGQLNTTGVNNTFVGRDVGISNTTGNSNSFFGQNAGQFNTTGTGNTFIGVNAGRYAGSGTTPMTSINNSTYLGVLSRGLNATGSSNEIVIGYDVVGLGSNTTVVGNSSTTLFRPYGNVAIGADTAGARLDVRAADGLSNAAFRVRNSVDTVTLTEIQGTGNLITRHNSSGSSLGLFHRTDTTGFSLTTGTSGYGTGNGIEIVTHTWILSSGARQFAFTTNGGTDGDLWTFQNNGSGAGKRMSLSKSGSETFCWSGENYSIGGNIWGNPPTETNSFGIKNGTAPSTNATDAFKLYSADIVAGNAAPHFRTENGNIIKLYRETTAVGASTLVSNAGTNITDTDTFDGYTLKQIVKALRNQGLLA